MSMSFKLYYIQLNHLVKFPITPAVYQKMISTNIRVYYAVLNVQKINTLHTLHIFLKISLYINAHITKPVLQNFRIIPSGI